MTFLALAALLTLPATITYLIGSRLERCTCELYGHCAACR